jgi:hypothetical protein
LPGATPLAYFVQPSAMKRSKKLERFSLAKTFQPALIFASEAGVYPTVPTLTSTLEAWPVMNNLPGTNTLAYFALQSVTDSLNEQECFLLVKHFQFTLLACRLLACRVLACRLLACRLLACRLLAGFAMNTFSGTNALAYLSALDESNSFLILILKTR